MAITNAQARRKWLGPIRDAYASRLVFRELTNRRFEGDARDTYELTLNTTRASFDVTETDRTATRNPSLPAAQTTSQVEDTLTMQWTVQVSVFHHDMDLLEGSPDAMPVTMREAAYKLAQKADDRIRTILLAGIPAANDGVQAGAAAAFRFGAANKFLNAMGESDDADVRLYVPTMIRRVGHQYRANDYWKLGAPDFDERQPYLIMPNALGTALGVYIDLDKPSDQLVNQFTRSDGVRMGGVFGVWKDIPILLTNRLATIAAGGKSHFQAIVHNPAAITAAFRTPMIEFNQGVIMVKQQDGSFEKLFGWEMNAQATFGATVVNPSLLMRYAIRAEA